MLLWNSRNRSESLSTVPVTHCPPSSVFSMFPSLLMMNQVLPVTVCSPIRVWISDHHDFLTHSHWADTFLQACKRRGGVPSQTSQSNYRYVDPPDLSPNQTAEPARPLASVSVRVSRQPRLLFYLIFIPAPLSDWQGERFNKDGPTGYGNASSPVEPLACLGTAFQKICTVFSLDPTGVCSSGRSWPALLWFWLISHCVSSDQEQRVAPDQGT